MPHLSRREWMLAATATLAGGALGGRMLWQRRHDDAILALVDPELRNAMQRHLDSLPGPPLSVETLADYRRIEAAGTPPPLHAPTVQRIAVPGPNGAPPVGIDLIDARPGQARPAVMYLHGGGFVAGNSAGAVRQLQRLALAIDGVAVAVDYRLAPETRHAGILDDCSAALRWVHDQADSIGVDPARIAIMGASAGGGLAALLALRARDEGVVRAAQLMLVYPMLDDRTDATAAPADLPMVWDAAQNRFAWNAFLGPQADARAVPARRADLAGLPATTILVGALDLFLREDLAFAERLRRARVPTEVHVIPGAFHGFDLTVPQSRLASRFRSTIAASLRNRLAP